MHSGAKRSLWPRDTRSGGGWSREKRRGSPLDIARARNYDIFLLPARGDGFFTLVAFPIAQTADFRLRTWYTPGTRGTRF